MLLTKWKCVSVSAVCMALLFSVSVTAADSTFPAKIQFKASKGLFSVGSLRMSFGENIIPGGGDRYEITLSNFEGFGIRSRQQLISFIFKDDLTLLGHMVLGEDGEKIYEIFADDECESAIAQEKTRCFKYRAGESVNMAQVEFFTPYETIDFASSIVVAACAVNAKRFKTTKSFNLIFNGVAKQVTVHYVATVEVGTPIGRYEAIVLSFRSKNSGAELYRLYVGRDENGSYPVKILFADDEGKSIELVVNEVRW